MRIIHRELDLDILLLDDRSDQQQMQQIARKLFDHANVSVQGLQSLLMDRGKALCARFRANLKAVGVPTSHEKRIGSPL